MTESKLILQPGDVSLAELRRIHTGGVRLEMAAEARAGLGAGRQGDGGENGGCGEKGRAFHGTELQKISVARQLPAASSVSRRPFTPSHMR